jgi:hypothetical protein
MRIFYCIPAFLLASIAMIFAQENQTSHNYQTAAPGVDDLITIKTILSQCGFAKAQVEDVAKFENGRAVLLDLSNKDFSGDGIKVLPSVIGELTELRALILKDNKITSLPFEIFKLKKLQKLDLASNSVEIIPASISEFKNLDSLDLRYNGIVTLPHEIANLTNLKYLQLWGNKLVEVGKSIILLPQLAELYLKDNRLTQLPDGLAKMKTLTYIDLQGNFLCNVSPKIDAWLKEKDKRYRMLQKCH